MLAPARAATLHNVRVFCFAYCARGRSCDGKARIVCRFSDTYARTYFIQLTDSLGDVLGHEWLSNVDKQDWCNGVCTQICLCERL